MAEKRPSVRGMWFSPFFFNVDSFFLLFSHIPFIHTLFLSLVAHLHIFLNSEVVPQQVINAFKNNCGLF